MVMPGHRHTPHGRICVSRRLFNDAGLDSDNEESVPHVVFTSAVTAQDVADQITQSTGDNVHPPRDNETPAGTRGGLQVSASTPQAAAAVMAERERARRRLARYRERRATVVLGVVMASFVGCWLPFFSLYPLSLLVGFHVPAPLFAVIFWLGYCNSALNPIIYTVFNREFRAAFRRMLCPGRPPAAKPPPSRF